MLTLSYWITVFVENLVDTLDYKILDSKYFGCYYFVLINFACKISIEVKN